MSEDSTSTPDNPTEEHPAIKQEKIDPEDVLIGAPDISVLNIVKQELETIKQEADCEITRLFVSRNGECTKVELLSDNTDENRQNVSLPNLTAEPKLADTTQKVETDTGISKTTSNYDKLLKCSRCSFVASSKIGFAIHKGQMHQDAVKNRKKCTQMRSSTVQAIHSRNMMQKRRKRYKTYLCSICNLRYESKYRLECHKKCHDMKSDFRCPGCKAFFRNPWSLEIHVKAKCFESVDTLKSLQCQFCEKNFFTIEYLNYHELKDCRSNQSYICCQVCNSRFKNVWSLEVHSRLRCSKSNQIRFQCSFCEKKFASIEYLNYHERKQHSVSSLTCSCGKTFKTPKLLYLHKKVTHRSLQQCPFCHELLKDLKRHMSTCQIKMGNSLDSVIEPSASEAGHESFALKTDIEKDFLKISQELQISRDKEQTFRCHICDRPFAHRDSRDRHIRKRVCIKDKQSVPLKEPFSCSMCNKTFSHRESRIRHIRKQVCVKDKPSLQGSKIGGSKKPLKMSQLIKELSSDPCPGCSEKFETEKFLKRHMKYCSML